MVRRKSVVSMTLQCIEGKRERLENLIDFEENGRLVVDEENVIPLNLVRRLAEDSGFRFFKCLRKTAQIFEKVEE